MSGLVFNGGVGEGTQMAAIPLGAVDQTDMLQLACIRDQMLKRITQRANV